MLNIDLEPLKELYQEILKTQAISERELKALKYLIDKLQETKEDFENSSFAILNKNTELFKNSDNILQNMQKLSNSLNYLARKIENEKLNFDKDIKEKLDKIEKDLINADIEIMRKKERIFRTLLNVETTIDNEQKKIEEKIKKINENYKKIISDSVDKFNNQLEEYIDDFEREIKQKTFFQRWGAVIVAFGFGVIISFAYLIPTLKKFVENENAQQEVISKLQKENKKLKNEIEYLSEYKIPDSWRFTCNPKTNPHNCIGVPAKFVEEDYYNNKKYYFINLPKNK